MNSMSNEYMTGNTEKYFYFELKESEYEIQKCNSKNPMECEWFAHLLDAYLLDAAIRFFSWLR